MNKSKYKSKKSDSRGKGKREPHTREHEVKTDQRKVSGPINDANYYFTNDVIKSQLANISFNEFTGTTNSVTSLVDGSSRPENIPYAMRIALNPSAGFTDAEGDTTLGNSLNLAALSLYTKLSANNAKTTNYAPQDITMLMLALGSVIELTSHIKRAFGTAYLYNQRNRAYPKSIMTTIGVDYDDLMANFANYRAQFNTMMVSAAKIPFPTNVAYFRKCEELYSGIYLDMEGSDMAQSYAFVPNSVWVLDEEIYEEGTILLPLVVSEVGNVAKMSVLLGQLNLMLSNLLNSSTLNSIYSDILRVALKEGMQLYQFEAIPDGYVVLPHYEPEIRLWINNLTVMGDPVGSPSDGYTQGNRVYPDVDTNKIVYRPQFDAITNLNTALVTPYLNFDYGNPTVDDLVVATRLLSLPKFELIGDSYKTTAVALPDHYVTYVSVYLPDGSHNSLDNFVSNTQWPTFMMALSVFDWAPMFHMTNPNDPGYLGFFGDLNYYTSVDYHYMSRLHDATYLGLFEIR